MSARQRPSVAVIGAGIQGIGVALELAARGIAVDLLEKSDRVHGQASLANEGKIHLGYIYSNDPSLRTATQMTEGAWTFSPILRDWLERDLGEAHRSIPFTYLVHRQSLLDATTLEGMYRRIATLNADMAARPGASYFGLDATRPPRMLTQADREKRFGPDVIGAYETPEIAVDTEAIGKALERRVAEDPRVVLRLGSEVLSAVPDTGGVVLTSRDGASSESRRYDHVVNASWDDLLRIDATAGLPPPAGASFRLRRIVRARGPHHGEGVGSYSVVLGPFGDLVEFGRGDLFLSWYPVGRRAMLPAIRPPDEWSLGVPPEEADEIRTRTHAALRDLIPGLASVRDAAVASATVHSGVVYARGTTDIHDPGSGLHERYEIGPRSFGSYHTVDTGKYTTAPLFARRLAERIAESRA